MSTKPCASLTRLGDSVLLPLHNTIRAAFPELVTGDIAARRETYRKRAFNGTASYRLFKHNYVRSQVLKRFQEGSITPQARLQAAIDKWVVAEERCGQTNARLTGAFESSALISPKELRLLKRVRREVGRVLGDFDIQQFFAGCDFSGGATTEFRRAHASVQHKWHKGSHITRKAVPLLRAFDAYVGSPFNRDRVLVEVEGGEVFTVLKNYEEDRTCDKQPTLNIFQQKSLGGMIRSALNRVGLLLPDAQVYHQRLAQEGSVDGRHACGDLVSASDTVALVLAELFLPRLWGGAIAVTRCDSTRLPSGQSVILEKVASMGNGFVFELETLIFYGVLRAVCGKDACISVYGDDLIYPPKFHSEVSEALETLGFLMNTEKSFATGSFRESCGGHFFGGHDVKPFYIEQYPRTYGQVINLHNDIVAYHGNMPRNEAYLAIASACRRLIPRTFWGPMGLDGVLWSEWDEATPRYKKRNGKPERSKFTGKKHPGPCYQHWVVKRIVYVVPHQLHDYYMGGLLKALWKGRWRKPHSNHYRGKSLLPKYLGNMHHRWIEDAGLSSSAFFFPEAKREKITTAVVGVASQWRRLPVRVSEQ